MGGGGKYCYTSNGSQTKQLNTFGAAFVLLFNKDHYINRLGELHDDESTNRNENNATSVQTPAVQNKI